MKKIITAFILLCNTCTICAQNVLTVDSKRNDDKSVDFFYNKTKPGTYTVVVTFRSLENAYYTPEKYLVTNFDGPLFTLKPTDPNKGISYSYSYRYIQGTFKPKGVDTSFVYLLPFEKEKIIQAAEHSNLGEVYLKQARPKGWKAYQFRGEALDSVYAARKGIVINVRDEFEQDTTAIFTSKTNQVVVEHPDGSVAVYKGFKKKGIVVKEGENIFPHTFLGVLGNELVTHKKYLSFMVYYLSDLGFEENKRPETTFITPRFLTASGSIILTNRQKYTAAVSDEIITKEMTRREGKKITPIAHFVIAFTLS